MLTIGRDYAPYASPSNVLTVIHRFRQYGLPEVLTAQEIMRLSIPDASATRTLTALKHLRLIDEDGRLTPEFQQIGKASKTEYPMLMAQAVQVAYSPIFTILDPAQASDTELEDAFRHYEPRAQRTRMITLFMALCQESGLVPEGTVKRATVQKRPSVKKPAATASEHRKRPTTHDESTGPERVYQDNENAQYQLLLACVGQLPKNGKWTAVRRDRWIQAMTANLDYLIEVVETDETGQDSPDARTPGLRAAT